MSEPREGSPPPDGFTITFTRRQTAGAAPVFAVHVRVDLGGHQVALDIEMGAEMVLPIELDGAQKLVLLVKEGELLIDSSHVDRTVAVVVREADPDELEEGG